MSTMYDDIDRSCETKELSLNEFQRSMHSYNKAHEECHALGIVGELAEVVEQLLPATITSDDSYAAQLRVTTVFKAAGRIADIVKKASSHAVAADRSALLKELGDVLWYITAVARDNDITLEEVAQGNITKLAARYPNGFEKGGGVRDETQPHILSCSEYHHHQPSKGCCSPNCWCQAGPAGQDYESMRARGEVGTINYSEIPATLCEHANECPSVCPCPPHCYCRRVGSAPSCKPRGHYISNMCVCGYSLERHVFNSECPSRYGVFMPRLSRARS